MKSLKEIGKIIRSQRLKLNITMDQCAAKAGITRATLWSIEQGTSNCSIFSLLNLLNVLNLDMDISGSDGKAHRIRATRTNTLIEKKQNNFIIMCIEEYAKSINKDSSTVYKDLNKFGLIEELTNDYEDLHGYSTEMINEHISLLLKGVK